MIAAERIAWPARRPPVAGRYVLYWMQRAQRAEFNQALEFAIGEANRLGLPCLVGFGLAADYPEANRRHYAFMLEGLGETEAALARRGLRLVVRRGPPARVAAELAREAALLVCDRGHLRHETAWRRDAAAAVACPVAEIETETVVPLARASLRRETAARTLRPKIFAELEACLQPVEPVRPLHASLALPVAGDVAASDVAGTLDRLGLDRSIAPVAAFRGGAAAARERLAAFLEAGLPAYAARRGDPAAGAVSRLGPYLHFGQISPIEVALGLRRSGEWEGLAKFFDELIVRRELALNFVAHTEAYDSYTAVPDWARASLARHAADPRPRLYDRETLAAAATDDPYWNAAMTEMLVTGYMHNRMRMYWGKRIIAWTREPEEAHAVALALNNRYLLDGRDANSFANIGWLFGLHDRPWPEQPIFGAVRAMTAAGLRRKGSGIAAYVAQMARLAPRAER